MTVDRESLIEDIAETLSEGIDLKALVAYFYDKQVEWLENESNHELIDHGKCYIHNFNPEDYIEGD